MAGKIFEMAFNIAAKLNSSFNNSFAAASNRLVNLSSEIEKLERIQKQADGMVALGRKIRENTTRFNEAQRRVQQLAQAIRSSEQPTRQMQRDYESAQREVSALNRVLANQRAELRSVSASLREAGFNTRNFQESQRTLRNQLETARAQRAPLQSQVDSGNARAAAIRANENAQRINAQRRGEYQGQMLGAVAMAAPIAWVAKTAMDFEAKMSKVQAITTANEEDMKRLTEKARELGSTTQFTATQAAEAMSYLGMAGWNAGQIIGGMPGLLNLAAAGNVNLARTADIVSDVMTAMGLDAAKDYKEGVSNAMHTADVFAYTITKTNTDVSMMGETMKYVAPIAKEFGVSLEETAALTGLMGNAGTKASQAGTSLRAGFLRLAGPPKKASKALEEMGMSLDNINTEQREAAGTLASLGISMDDMSGKPKKMSAILRELYERTANFTEEQKISTLGAIFGFNAVTGWLNVLRAGPEAFDKMTKALENCDGTSQKVADTMADNARGAVIALESAVESLSISLGNVLLPSLAWVATGAAGVTRKISAFTQEYPALTKYVVGAGAAIAGLTIGVTALGYAYTFIKGGILGFKGMLLAMRSTTIGATVAQWMFNTALYGCPITWLVAGIATVVGAGYLLYKNWDMVKSKTLELWSIFEQKFPKLAAMAGSYIGFVISFWSDAWDIAVSVFNSAMTVIKALLDGDLDGCAELIGLFVGRAENWFEKLGAKFSYFFSYENLTALAKSGLEAFSNFASSKLSSILPDWMIGGGGKGSIAAPNKDTAPSLMERFKIGRETGRKGAYGIDSNASGGIYSKGAFLTTFAENSPEAAIPIDGSSRAISLWQKTGQLLGVFDNTNDEARGLAKFAQTPPNISNTNATSISLSAPITITINGNTDSNTVKQIESTIIQSVVPKLEQKLKEIEWQSRRVSYA